MTQREICISAALTVGQALYHFCQFSLPTNGSAKVSDANTGMPYMLRVIGGDVAHDAAAIGAAGAQFLASLPFPAAPLFCKKLLCARCDDADIGFDDFCRCFAMPLRFA